MVKYLCKWKERPNDTLVFTAGDWRGCQKNSTINNRRCHHVSVVCDCTLEAALNAAVKADCETLRMKQMCEHSGVQVVFNMFGDSSAMQGALSRKRVWKVKKTLEGATALATRTHSLWICGSSRNVSGIESTSLLEFTTGSTSEERTCCMREPVGKCPLLGSYTHEVARPTWATEWKQAKEIVRRPKTSKTRTTSSS